MKFASRWWRAVVKNPNREQDFFETDGTSLLPDDLSPEGIAAAWDTITSEDRMENFTRGYEQASKFSKNSAAKLGLKL